MDVFLYRDQECIPDLVVFLGGNADIREHYCSINQITIYEPIILTDKGREILRSGCEVVKDGGKFKVVNPNV